MPQEVWISLIGFAGMFIRGLTGFGSGLVMTPLMLLVLDLQTTVVLVTLVEMGASIPVTLGARREVDGRLLRQLLPATVAGLAVGAVILVKGETQTLKVIFAAGTLLFALRIVATARRGPARRTPWPKPAGYAAGGLAGILGGLFGTPGPPVTIYLENQLAVRQNLRATMMIYFYILDAVRLTMYVIAELVGLAVLHTGLVALPAALLGAWLGERITARTNETVFRTLVGLVLIGTSATLLLGS